MKSTHTSDNLSCLQTRHSSRYLRQVRLLFHIPSALVQRNWRNPSMLHCQEEAQDLSSWQAEAVRSFNCRHSKQVEMGARISLKKEPGRERLPLSTAFSSHTFPLNLQGQTPDGDGHSAFFATWKQTKNAKFLCRLIQEYVFTPSVWQRQHAKHCHLYVLIFLEHIFWSYCYI